MIFVRIRLNLCIKFFSVCCRFDVNFLQQAPPAQKILQVGNMLQIVPSDMVPIMPSVLPPRFSKERTPSPDKMDVSERLSAEDVLDNRMAENSRKRKIKEDRKKDKEKKKKEKAKRRKMRLKVSTEDMIKVGFVILRS